MSDQDHAVCQVCKREKPLAELAPAEMIRGNVLELIRQQVPDWSPSGFICQADLNRFRAEYVEDILEEAKGKLSEAEREVIDSVRERDILSVNSALEFDQTLTFGQKMADHIATFGGSWSFLGVFSGIMLSWIVVNSVLLTSHPFDPYPYILLNLALSCLAAVQAPVIMMSQNRQEARDRLRGEHDYQVNLKAELEIRLLSEKIDRLVNHQWKRLLEIQQIQTDLLEDTLRAAPGRREPPPA